MSLFESSLFSWRETYFLFLQANDRPTAEEAVKVLAPLKGRIVIENTQDDDEGKLEAMTILAPSDSAGIDVTYVTGEELDEQKAELKKELRGAKLPADEQAKLERILAADARFDFFHFQQLSDDPREDEEFLDPGALLSIMSQLAKLCHGTAYDPQSSSLM